MKPTINKFLHTKWQQQWSNNIQNKGLLNSAYLGRVETSIAKIKKRTSRYIPTANWSNKAYSLFHSETGTTTSVLTC